MKRAALLILIAALFIFLTGCGEDSPVQGSNNQTLVLSGQINGWTYGDSLTMAVSDGIGYPLYLLGSANIAADGKFSVTATVPSPDKFVPVTEIYNRDYYSPVTLAFSDSAAKFFCGYLMIKRGDAVWGSAEWRNLASIEYLTFGKKLYRARYYYFDRDVEITGTVFCPSSGGLEITFNISAKAGWNTFLNGLDENFNGYYENYEPISGAYYYSRARQSL